MSEEKNSDLNEQNAQPQQPQQNYGQQGGNRQPPNGYAQPQQPYYQQQNGYGQPPQQPYYQQPYYQQPPQQPYYVQPAVPVQMKASPAEKQATFSTGGSIYMLILCIVGTINLITGLIGKILSFDIGGIILFVLEILIVVGMWLVFANSKRKKLSTTGISLIRVPFVIQFVFSVFAFIGNLAIWIITFNVIGLVIGIIAFIIQCIYFSSVNKTLLIARDLNSDKSVAGRSAGLFAAVITIIYAVIDLVKEIVNYLILEALKIALGDSFLAKLLGGGGVITIVVAAVAFFVGICGAIVILQFNKNLKQANG